MRDVRLQVSRYGCLVGFRKLVRAEMQPAAQAAQRLVISLVSTLCKVSADVQ